MSNKTETEAPPLYPKLPPEALEKMSAQEVADYLGKVGAASLARYANRPDLLLKENPHLDFENLAKQ